MLCLPAFAKDHSAEYKMGTLVLVPMHVEDKKQTSYTDTTDCHDSPFGLQCSGGIVDNYDGWLVAEMPDGHEKVRVDSGWTGLGGGIVLSGDNGPNALLTSTFLSISRDNNKTGTTMAEDGLIVSDSRGFEAAIGAVSLVTPSTGETHKTSVASLVLFDKDKNVIWKAP